MKGEYVLKIAEPMDEVVYLDRLQLVVVGHPADVRVYPDERFTSPGPPPSQDLLAFRQEIFPEKGAIIAAAMSPKPCGIGIARP